MYESTLKSNYPQTLDAACATTQSEIQEKFQSLESNMHYLSTALDGLENRLIPVLRIDTANEINKAPGAPQPIMSPVAERLTSVSSQASSISGRIDKLLHLLAL